MLSFISSLFSFIYIFSIFNDNFMVDNLGSASLKIIFVLFVLFNFSKVILSFKHFSNIHKYFYLLIFNIFFITLINTIEENYSSKFLIDNTILIIAILIIFTFYSQSNLKKTLDFVWISISISVIICYFNEPISEWTFRTTGGTGDPNEFATHLLIYLFLSIYLYKTYLNKIYIFIGIPFFFYGILMASSKSSFLALAILLTLLSTSKMKNIFNYKSFLFLGILILGISFIDFSEFELILNALSRFDSNNTASHRLDSWFAGLNMIQNNLLTGIGMEEYANNIILYSDVYLDPASRAPHNVYLAIFAENGIIVFILFLFFISTLFRNNFFYLFKSKLIYIQFMYLSLFLMAFTLGIQYDKYTWLILAIYVNILYSIKGDKYENNSNYS